MCVYKIKVQYIYYEEKICNILYKIADKKIITHYFRYFLYDCKLHKNI